MKTRLALSILGALALPALARAQSASTPPRAPADNTTSPATTSSPTSPATAEATVRFSSFDGASATVISAVTNAQTIAAEIRQAPLGTSAVSRPDLSRAVAQANAAIVQDGRVARSTILAERQASLTRLRLAQTEAERRRLIGELRVQFGQRMEEQREVARLVRDRLRELRTTTMITRPGGN